MALTPDHDLTAAAALITKAAIRVAKTERDLEVERKRRAEIWRERNMLVDRLQRASLGIAVTLDTGRVGHNGHPESDGDPECAGCWWEAMKRILAIIDGTDKAGS